MAARGILNLSLMLFVPDLQMRIRFAPLLKAKIKILFKVLLKGYSSAIGQYSLNKIVLKLF
jgi:hypothetical protein